MTEHIETPRFVVECHTEQTILFHITTSNSVTSIRKKGILPSEFGDIDIAVEGCKDGCGVYALDKDSSNDALIKELSSGGEKLCYIKFITCGPWYKVIRDKDFENGLSSTNHVGYILHPNRVPRGNLLGKREIINN